MTPSAAETTHRQVETLWVKLRMYPQGGEKLCTGH